MLANRTITARTASARTDVGRDAWDFIWLNSLMNDLAERASQRGKQRMGGYYSTPVLPTSEENYDLTARRFLSPELNCHSSYYLLILGHPHIRGHRARDLIHCLLLRLQRTARTCLSLSWRDVS